MKDRNSDWNEAWTGNSYIQWLILICHVSLTFTFTVFFPFSYVFFSASFPNICCTEVPLSHSSLPLLHLLSLPTSSSLTKNIFSKSCPSNSFLGLLHNFFIKERNYAQKIVFYSQAKYVYDPNWHLNQVSLLCWEKKHILDIIPARIQDSNRRNHSYAIQLFISLYKLWIISLSFGARLIFVTVFIIRSLQHQHQHPRNALLSLTF